MGENLHVCVYGGCGKSFTAPVRLTDLSHRPRSETYYACPYCFSKMNESEHDLSHELKLMKADGYEETASDNPKKQAARKGDEKKDVKENEKGDIPFECPHHVGYLKKRSKEESVPDSCLTCPKILQCMV